MKKLLFCCGMIGCLGTAVLMADTSTPESINDRVIASEDPSFNVGLKAGTLGVGIDISKPINDFVSVRVNANRFRYTTTENSLYSNLITADKRYDLNTNGVLFDFHLLQLRVTAGAYVNNNEIHYTSKPTAANALIFNGKHYGVDMLGKVETTVNFNRFSPYVGVGWGNNGNREGWGGWNLTLDLGLMYHGDPKVKIKADINDALPSAIQDAINISLKEEAKRQERDLADFPFYPVVMVGINYSF